MTNPSLASNDDAPKSMRKKQFVQDLVHKWAVPNTRPYDITLTRNALEQKILEKELLMLSEKRMRALRKVAYEKRMFIHRLRSRRKGLQTLVSRMNLQDVDKNFALDFAMFTKSGTEAFTADEEFLLTEEVYQQKTEQENLQFNNRRIAKSFEHYCSTQSKQGRFSPIKQEEIDGSLSRAGSRASNNYRLTPRGSGNGNARISSRLLSKRQSSSDESGMSQKLNTLSLETINDS